MIERIYNWLNFFWWHCAISCRACCVVAFYRTPVLDEMSSSEAAFAAPFDFSEVYPSVMRRKGWAGMTQVTVGCDGCAGMLAATGDSVACAACAAKAHLHKGADVWCTKADAAAFNVDASKNSVPVTTEVADNAMATKPKTADFIAACADVGNAEADVEDDELDDVEDDELDDVEDDELDDVEDDELDDVEDDDKAEAAGNSSVCCWQPFCLLLREPRLRQQHWLLNWPRLMSAMHQ